MLVAHMRTVLPLSLMPADLELCRHMKFQIPTDPHELAWLTEIAISAHCSISSNGRFTEGFGVWYRSAVSHLLSEANHAKGYAYSGKVLPLLGGLSALDQFGLCYEPNPSTFPVALSSKSGIIKAAHNFLGILVDTPDSDALYALRNALMHQASLISVGKQAKPKHYWFEIDNSIPDLFIHATTAWDGQFNTRNDSNKTVVNASGLLKRALSVPGHIKELHQKGQMSLNLAGGLEELLTNYVQLDFETSFRDSYLFYLQTLIHRTLHLPEEGAAIARLKLKDIPMNAVEESAKTIARGLQGPTLERLVQAFPGAAPNQ